MILYPIDSFLLSILITAELERLKKLMKLIPAKVNNYFKVEMKIY